MPLILKVPKKRDIECFPKLGYNFGSTYKMGTESIFEFGKHKGKNIIDVLDTDPTYVHWLLAGEVNFVMTKNLEDFITEEFGLKWTSGVEDNFELQRQRYDCLLQIEEEKENARFEREDFRDYNPYEEHFALPDGSDLYDDSNAHLDGFADAYWNLD